MSKPEPDVQSTNESNLQNESNENVDEQKVPEKFDNPTYEFISNVLGTALPSKKDEIINIPTQNNESSFKQDFVIYMERQTTPAAEEEHHGLGEYNPETRNGFVAKVLGITALMLMATAMFCFLAAFSDELREFLLDYHLFLSIGGCVIVIANTCILAMSDCARDFPCNIIILVTTTIGMSIICAIATSIYNTKIVAYAFGTTTIVVIVCSLLALSSFDFTKWLIYVVVISMVLGVLLMIIVLVKIFTGEQLTLLHLVILLGSTLAQAVMLIIELQMILGGKSVELSEYDYAYGAFLLYTSIISLFLKILHIFKLIDEL